MDEDKKDKNYFKVPNEYQDALCQIRIPGQARQVLDVIERFTWGWNKKEADISFKTFRKRTGMDNRHIVRARNRLIQMNIITVAKKGNKKRAYYRIQTDYTKWKPLPKKARGKPSSKKATKAIAKKDDKSLPKKATPSIKDIYTNDIIFKDNEIDKIIEQLKTRKRDLEEDLKEKGPDDNKQYLIDAIKEIDEQLHRQEGKERAVGEERAR